MTYYDVFNGDADGILSLVQLRQVQPRDSILITGVKRDIELLKQVPIDGSSNSSGKTITVLDVSMEKNKAALQAQLTDGADVFYADHHRSGNIPQQVNLNANIDLDANTCTALIVDKLLNGEKHHWAIAAAYGDNLISVADSLAKTAGLSETEAEQLKELGVLINYNGYGESLDDLHFEPANLYNNLVQYPSPFDCISDQHSPFHLLKNAYQSDLKKAQSAVVVNDDDTLLALELEDAAWARRISGVFGNQLANQNPDKAILILTQNTDSSYRVSLRAPINNKQGAGDVCSQFETGGGRAAAAGINNLPQTELKSLLSLVSRFYG
ncbi:DHH family phosphoesterase [Psychrosphaera sp. F3M07]|uniref:DHHA1 domain-containing protein n=1 Tax=Psychrosphaera sp. F3M07 TaxID=2841560 RepID=UPI001C0921B3|nr:DHH family phosphoesterase [Psychrosphaera sp. F3M07]MBU2917725.1 DHH family phosphoesterase [Psychrosphaera sp. F3M07]